MAGAELRADQPRSPLMRWLLNPRRRVAVPAAALALGLGAWALLWRRWPGLRGPLAAVAALGAAVAARGLDEALRPEVAELTLATPNLPPAFDGLLIAHLSDFHLGEPLITPGIRRTVRRVMRQRPDLVVVTGDFVTDRLHPALAPLLDLLAAPLGVFGIWGNHDYWGDHAALAALVAAHGVAILDNAAVPLHRGAATIWLAGVDDQWLGSARLDTALAAVPSGAWTLLLAHAPDLATAAAARGVALQLSGHTHGGQIVLPLRGALWLPRFSGRFVGGVYRVGAMWLYVSRGLGGMPLRLGSRAQATLIRVTRG